jgi:hypothetical protein
MNASGRLWRLLSTYAGGGLILSAVFVGAMTATPSANADCTCWRGRLHLACRHCQNCQNYVQGPGDICDSDDGGVWYWMRSPEQERRVVISLYNRYCIRCHGVDGRGVWDIPDVPDFTNVRWQASRPDGYRARIIMEGRGAVMPPFRGTLTLEEGWALSRYLHSFVPGSELSRPDLGGPPSQPVNGSAPTPAAGATPTPAPVSPPPNPASPGPFNP